MRYSTLLIPTMKETPADAQVVSHRLMTRAGMIRKVASGVYTYLPLGWRVLNKVSAIIREELEKAGAQELMMPMVQPAELWQESGRWDAYGPELLRLNDRKNAEFCLGPTHEEVITSLVRDAVKSYKQLPLNLFQIQTKFRDEIRPRFGLMRGREFIMKDAYSFDVSDEAASAAYDKMYDAYNAIFRRCGLQFAPVEADTGSIGGQRSHEFQVLAETGEDTIVRCPETGYAANVELAAIYAGDVPALPEGLAAVERVKTPGKKTIDDVSGFLAVEPAQVIKALVFRADDDVVVALCRGDRDVNAIKLRRALGAEHVELMADRDVAELGGAVGSIGPMDLPFEARVVADHGLAGAHGMVCGANEADMHLAQVAVGRDFEPAFFDLRTAQAGDPSTATAQFEEHRGIEVGHVFFLGTKYSEALGATVLDEQGKATPLVMGCYGIGVGRTAAAAIEQNHDDGGIVWPAPIAPFQVALLALGKDDAVKEASEALYQELRALGVDVLFDDRDVRPGGKFKDHDLIGCPVRLSVGARGLKNGTIELKRRRDGRDGSEDVAVADAAATAKAWVDALMDEAR